MDDSQKLFPTPPNFAVLAATFEGSLVFIALSWGWMIDISPTDSLHWSWLDLCWGVLATIPPLIVLGLCLYLPWEPFRRILRLLDETILPLFRDCRPFEIAVIAILAGLGEEMLFRPIVQEGMAQWIGGASGPVLGLLIAAILFGLLHKLTITYAILAGLIGLYLGGIWLLSGNLLVPITAHGLYDFASIMILLKLHKPAEVEKKDD
jgi:membrane protease YdiL (CAAX protease family)